MISINKHVVLLMVLLSWGGAVLANDHGDVKKPDINIVLGVIENATRFEVTNVRVIHRPTGALVGFSPILPFQKAELGIPPRQLMSNIAIVSWTHQGERYEVTLDIPRESAQGMEGEMILLYTIGLLGDISVKLLPVN